MWSSDFDFSYTICRFRMQIPNSSPTSCCVYLLSITLYNCLAICFLPSSRFLQNIGEFGPKKYITDHRTADKTQFVVVIKHCSKCHLFRYSHVILEWFCPLLNVYFNDMKINRWRLHLSASRWGIPLRCNLFRKRIDQKKFFLWQPRIEFYQLFDGL